MTADIFWVDRVQQCVGVFALAHVPLYVDHINGVCYLKLSNIYVFESKKKVWVQCVKSGSSKN